MAGPLQGRATYSSCQPLLQIAPPTIRSTAPEKLLKLASNVLLYQGNVAHEANEQPRLEHPQWNRNGVLVEEGGDEKHDRDRCATRPTWWITDLHDDVFFGKNLLQEEVYRYAEGTIDALADSSFAKTLKSLWNSTNRGRSLDRQNRAIPQRCLSTNGRRGSLLAARWCDWGSPAWK